MIKTLDVPVCFSLQPSTLTFTSLTNAKNEPSRKGLQRMQTAEGISEHADQETFGDIDLGPL